MVGDATPLSGREQRRAFATVATQRLAESLDELLGERFQVERGKKPDYFTDGPGVDAFSILERCPRRLANPAQDYIDSITTARRRIGLLAMRRLTITPSSSIAGAVREVMADPEYWPTKLRQWVEELDRAGAAALSSAVITWCHGAVRLVGRDARVAWADPVMSPRWNVPGRIVQLRGSVDATIGTVGRGEKLLLLGDAVPGPGDRLRAGYAALLRSVTSGHAPIRVTLGSPATGTMQPVEVNAELLELVTDRVVEVVSHRAAPDQAPPIPGRWCVHCHLLDICSEGAAHVGMVADV